MLLMSVKPSAGSHSADNTNHQPRDKTIRLSAYRQETNLIK